MLFHGFLHHFVRHLRHGISDRGNRCPAMEPLSVMARRRLPASPSLAVTVYLPIHYESSTYLLV